MVKVKADLLSFWVIRVDEFWQNEHDEEREDHHHHLKHIKTLVFTQNFNYETN